jgi:malate dehydrogenase (quinone)
MLDVLQRCFTDALPGWVARLTEMIPSYGRSIADDPNLLRQVRTETAATLRLEEPAAVG